MTTTDSKITRPVRQIQDIRKILGVKGGCAKLCKSANINEKAAHKPTDFQSYLPLTEQQRKSVNYSTAIRYYSNPIRLARAVVAKEAWTYLKPQAPYYRQTDFDGYDHDAGDWFTISSRETSITTDESLTVQVRGNGDAIPESGSLMALLELAYLSEYDFTDLNFGFLLRQGGFTESMTNCYYIPLTGMQTIRDYISTIPANVLDSVGTWHLMPVMTTADYEQGVRVSFYDEYTGYGIWYPLPYSNIMSINVVAPTYPVDKVSVSLYDTSQITGDSTTFRVNVPSLILSIVNNNDQEYEVTVRVSPAQNYIVGNIISGSFSERTVTVPAGGSANVDVVGSTVVWETVNNQALIEVALYVDGRSKTVGRLLIWSGRA